MKNQFFFILIEIFVLDIMIKYIRSIFEISKNEDVDSRKLRNQINRLLDQKMNSIIAFNAWKEKQRLHEKISIYENFIQMRYIDHLKEYSDNIVISIRHDIRQILQNYLLLVTKFEIEFEAFFSLSSSLSSCLASVLRYSSLKKIKITSKSKRISLTVLTIQNEKLSCNVVVLRHEVSRKIVINRLKKKRIMKDFSRNHQLLFD